MGAMEMTVVSTAMPTVVAELGGALHYGWVFSAYMLASTVMVPIWGKLGDLFGRKPILLAGILIFLAGSWLSGLSGEFGDLPLLGGGMVQLIVFRAIQGLGAGGLMVGAQAIVIGIDPVDVLVCESPFESLPALDEKGFVLRNGLLPVPGQQRGEPLGQVVALV